jgi:hypothetical protein
MTFAIPQGDIPMQTLNRAAGIAIVLFFGGLGLMIGARIEQVTIALLGGVLIALMVVIPATALVVGLIQRDWSATYTPHPVTPPAYYPPQPYYVAPPQAAKAYLPTQQPDTCDDLFTISKGRRVHIIGAPNGGSTSSTSQLLDEPDAF